MLVKPTHIVQDITTIDLDALWASGIRGLIFDLDNTIMAPSAGVLEEHIQDWLNQVREKGFRCIVVSNNPRMAYLKKAEAHLEMQVIGNAGKPRRKSLRQALSILSLRAEEVAIIGDRPLTDIWGGQRLGTTTILVDPLTKATEHQIVQFLRKLERLFVKQ